MDDWIKSLWCELRSGQYGSIATIDAAWDLICLADAGLVDPIKLNCYLKRKEELYLSKLAGKPDPRRVFPKHYATHFSYLADIALEDRPSIGYRAKPFEPPVSYKSQRRKEYKIATDL